jgi:thiamine biosynthesis lipoprotein ApbE
MMSAAAWGRDTARVGRALDAVRDTVDQPRGGRGDVEFDSLRREIRRRTGVTLGAGDGAEGYALDRAARVLAGVADSALLGIGSQFLWIGLHGTRRTVGIADPANTLEALATVEMLGGSVRTSSHEGSSASVTVLAPTGVAADAWSTALLSLGCEGALAIRQVSVVCADSGGGRVRWTPDLEGRVQVPPRP